MGFKSQFLDRRLSVDAAVFHTQSHNGYFFVYIAADSTQNLGNLDATYKGGELSLTARPTDRLDLYAGLRLHRQQNHRAWPIPRSSATRRRCVSKNTVNAGVAVPATARRRPHRRRVRLDYRKSAAPGGSRTTSPRAIRSIWSICALGLQAAKWTVTAWSKNLTNKIYNAEFSPGNVGGAGFLWRALPRRYGVDLDYRF